MRLVKYQGAGNDFLIAYGEDPGGDHDSWARRVCDRRFGVGADGLVRIAPARSAAVRMVIRNADGSRADMCGNALRCVARHLLDEGRGGPGPIIVETDQGPARVEAVAQGLRAEMGIPGLDRQEIPMAGPPGPAVREELQAAGGRFEVTALFLGNPHAVVFFEDVDALDLPRVGRAIGTHPVFPRGANVDFVQILGRREAKQRTWERGCGETLACGTGAGATLVAGLLAGWLEGPLLVHLRGGDLLVEWPERSGPVFVTGPAERVFATEWEPGRL
jgi:diaminopimelate epimerase